MFKASHGFRFWFGSRSSLVRQKNGVFFLHCQIGRLSLFKIEILYWVLMCLGQFPQVFATFTSERQESTYFEINKINVILNCWCPKFHPNCIELCIHVLYYTSDPFDMASWGLSAQRQKSVYKGVVSTMCHCLFSLLVKTQCLIWGSLNSSTGGPYGWV